VKLSLSTPGKPVREWRLSSTHT